MICSAVVGGLATTPLWNNGGAGKEKKKIQ
jgi:hypothetical protein